MKSKVEELLSRIVYTYDGEGKPVREEHYTIDKNGISEDNITKIVEYYYDKKGRLTSTDITEKGVVLCGTKESSDESNKKTLNNTCVNGAKKNVKDLEVYGDGDAFKLISKASSESQGWMKSTKAMNVGEYTVVIQVTTQQRNADGSYSVAEALTTVNDVQVVGSEADGYSLVNVATEFNEDDWYTKFGITPPGKESDEEEIKSCNCGRGREDIPVNQHQSINEAEMFRVFSSSLGIAREVYINGVKGSYLPGTSKEIVLEFDGKVLEIKPEKLISVFNKGKRNEIWKVVDNEIIITWDE